MNVRKRLITQTAVAVLLFAGGVWIRAWAADVPGFDEPGFEKGGAAWRSWGDGDFRDEYFGVKAHDGSFFLRLWSRSGWYQDFTSQKGAIYSVAVFVSSAKTDALWGDAFGEVKVEWRSKADGDVEVGTSTSARFDLVGKAGMTIPVGEWTRISLPPVKAPAGATHGRVLLTIYTEGGKKGGGCALFDDVSISQTP
jgi:hypothetical protein